MICWCCGLLNYVDYHSVFIFGSKYYGADKIIILNRTEIRLLFRALLEHCTRINNFKFVQINSSKFKDMSIWVTVLTNVWGLFISAYIKPKCMVYSLLNTKHQRTRGGSFHIDGVAFVGIKSLPFLEKMAISVSLHNRQTETWQK